MPICGSGIYQADAGGTFRQFFVRDTSSSPPDCYYSFLYQSDLDSINGSLSALQTLNTDLTARVAALETAVPASSAWTITAAEGATIGLAIALAWAVAWGYRTLIRQSRET